MSEPGELTPEALVTEEAKKICLELRPIVEESAGKSFKGYIPLTFRTLIDKEKNYLFKVYVDVNTCAHMGIVLNLPGGDKEKVTLIEVQYPKTASDPLMLPESKP